MKEATKLTIHRTERATVTLAELLQRELEKRNWSLRDAEGHTGVSRTALDAILKETTTIPTLETLYRLGDKFGIPLWRMVELAGFSSGIAPTGLPRDRVERALTLSQTMPHLAAVLDRVLELAPADMAGVLAYLEAIEAIQRRGPETVPPDE